MHDNTILSVDDAARLVHAAPETLLQYIRRGELMAARIGKNFVITHSALSTFVNALATRQSLERHAKHLQSAQDNLATIGGSNVRPRPEFVQVTKIDGTEPTKNKRKGRRTQLPALTTLSP